MVRKQASVLVGMVMTAVMLAGCGAGMNPAATAAQNARTVGVQGAAGKGAAVGRGGFAGPQAVVIDLKLTDDQKAQLKAIADKYKPAQPPQADLRKLLTADTVDEAALRSALAEIRSFETAQREAQFNQMSDTRAVYTDEQRATIVSALQSQPTPAARPADAARPAKADRPDFFADLADKLKLTDEQKAILDTLKPQSPMDKLGLTDEQKAALDALKPAAPATKPDPAARLAAEISFWQTGDTTQLKALAPEPADNTEALVKAATLLTADQRKALLGGGFGGGMAGRGPTGGPGAQPGHAGPAGFAGGKPGQGGPAAFAKGGRFGR